MPTYDGAPLITDLDELMTRDQLAEFFKISPNTVDNWRFGRGSKGPLPWLRLGNDIYFSRGQIVWWLNQYQKQPDAYHTERMRRLQEGIPVAKPRSKKPV